MEKLYKRINFENTPSKKTPLGEENLNKMDAGIDALDNRVVELNGTLVAEKDALKRELSNEVSSRKSADTALKNSIANEASRAKAEEQRIEELFTLPTQEAVDKWLGEHPEATTTVQDNSLTEPKIHSNFLKEIKNDFVIPQMFGAIGDGVADDTDAFASALASGKNVFISSGTYKITSALSIPNNIKVYGAGESTIIDVECDTLFEVESYYVREPSIEHLRIKANKHTVLNCNINTWGGCVRLKDVYITNASDRTIVFSECFNVLMENVRIEADNNAAGTLVYLSDGGSTFSNLVHLSDCFFMGCPGRVVNLVDIGTANEVNFFNCALQAFNIAVKGKANLYGCWVEDGTTAFSQKGVYTVGLHIANVETVLSAEDTAIEYVCPTAVSYRKPHYVGSDSLIKQVFNTKNDNLFRLGVQGTINGSYDEFDVLQWKGGKLVSNIPFNTDYYTGNANAEFYPTLGRYYKSTTGTLLIKFCYYRIHNNTSAQVSKETGVMRNGVYTRLDGEESNSEYPTKFSWDGSNGMFVVRNTHGTGTFICTMEVQRVSAT